MEEHKSSAEMQESLPTASEMLITARESLGLSQKEVADQLYLMVNFIIYIDEGSFEKIPKPAFIKGYLRSYARAVELSGDEVVKRYEEALQAADEIVEIRDVTEETVGSINFTGPVLQTGLVGLFGIVLVVAMVWWIATAGEDRERQVVITQPEPAAETSTNTQLSRSADLDFVLQNQVSDEIDFGEKDLSEAAVVEDESGLAEKGDGVEGPVKSRSESEVNTSGQRLLPITPTKDVSIDKYSDGGIRYITLDAGGFEKIEITFSGECWLEIEDGDGDSIYGDLNLPGDVLRVSGIAPFELLFGRATFAALTFNGEKVDLSRYIKADETAKVILGSSPERFFN